MFKSAVLATAIALTVLPQAFTANTITPTTTLAAETGNNTSAADTFTTQSDGNLGAGNVSKVDTRSLLYSGSATRIYAHFMPWFGGPNHMNVGYRSDDPAQVKRQVDDMLSRGIGGAIIDWYGPNSARENTTSIYMMQEAETRGGAFEFAIMEDGGALGSCANTAGCDLTGQLINDLTYVYNTFEPSSAYMRIDGRPVIFFFDADRYGTLDWTRVRNSVPGNPLLIFRNAGGFTHAQSNGSFSWVNLDTTNPNNWGQSYLDYFYQTGMKYPAETTYGTGYKGFNDTLASWGGNRIMNQNCGQTWLGSLNEISGLYSSANQLAAIQLVTWNDYEEGSEIETGVENCVAVSAAASGNTLTWSIGGSESTIDHYVVLASLDGQNLAVLTEMPVGSRSLDLGSFSLSAGTYQLYVKAVGKPSFSNHTSGAVSWTAAAAAQDQPPLASIAVSPASGTAPLTVTASTSGSSDPDGSIVSSTIDFGDGATAAGPTASHTYNSAGSYTVHGTVKDNAGMTASATTTASIASATAITSGVTVTSPVNGSTVTSPVHFVASARSAYPITAIRIYVDNLSMYLTYTSSLDANLSLPTGPHYVVVQAWDTQGTVYKTPLNISVGSTAVNQPPKPAISVTPSSGSAPLTVTASTAGATDPDGSIASTLIDFGDGAVANGPTATHTYTMAGNYTVSGWASDNQGATAGTTTPVSVSAAPAATSGVSILNPTATYTGGSPVRITATAVATSGKPITAMRIYVDNVIQSTMYSNSIDQYVPVARGSHYIAMVAWDSAGASYKSTVTISVQ